MSNLPSKAGALEQVLIDGDLSKLSEEQRASYYLSVCDSLNLNYLTKPFEYIKLNGKLTLYTTKNATDQLRNNNKISLNIVSREQVGDVFIVTATARNPDGREDSSTGAVFIGGLKGEALANAFLKAETKAKRRVTLSICGLSTPDESEVGSIPNAQLVETKLPLPAPAVRLNDARETPDQSKSALLVAIGTAQVKYGWKHSQVREFCTREFQAESSSQLTERQVEQLIYNMERNPNPVEKTPVA